MANTKDSGEDKAANANDTSADSPDEVAEADVMVPPPPIVLPGPASEILIQPYKTIDRVLPHEVRQSAEELATAAGVNLLVGMLRREMNEGTALRSDNHQLVAQVMQLTEQAARSDERLAVFEVLKWGPTAGFTIGGILAGLAVKVGGTVGILLGGTACVTWFVSTLGMTVLKRGAQRIRSKESQ